MNIVILGNGFVGKDLYHRLVEKGHKVCNPSFRKMKVEHDTARQDTEDIFNYVRDKFKEKEIDAFINTAGVVGRPLEWCEDHREETYWGNVEVPLFLASYAIGMGIPVIHVSTGCLYDNKKNQTNMRFSPQDQPNFYLPMHGASYYAYTKRRGEEALIELAKSARPSACMIDIHRIRLPFNETHDPSNLLYKIERFPELVHAANSITSLRAYANYVEKRIPVLKELFSKEDTTSQIIHAVHSRPVFYRQVVDVMRHSMQTKEKTFLPPHAIRNKTRKPRVNCVLSQAVLEEDVFEELRDMIHIYKNYLEV